MTLRHPSRLRAAAAAILTAALIAGFTVPMAGAVERHTPAIAAGVTTPNPAWAEELKRELAQRTDPAMAAAELDAAKEPR